jgi:hypothetical protein
LTRAAKDLSSLWRALKKTGEPKYVLPTRHELLTEHWLEVDISVRIIGESPLLTRMGHRCGPVANGLELDLFGHI